MAQLRCRCGTVLRDDGVNNFLLLQWVAFEAMERLDEVAGKAVDLWRCPVCERLWVFWDGDNATEYVRPES